MIQLIACDIDGTLLPYRGQEIPREIFREISRLMERGVLFCPTSGRQYTSLRRLFAPVADSLYYICENGTILFGPGNPGPVLGKWEMDREAALALSREILALPDCEVLLSGANTSYLCPKRPGFAEHFLESVHNNISLLSAPEEMPEAIIKVSAYCYSGAESAQQQLADRWKDRFHPAIAGPRWLDFTLSDKGQGLALLCRLLHIAPEHVAAFGDNFNDCSMLDFAGTSYLMEHAAPALLERYPNHCGDVAAVLARL